MSLHILIIVQIAMDRQASVSLADPCCEPAGEAGIVYVCTQLLLMTVLMAWMPHHRFLHNIEYIDTSMSSALLQNADVVKQLAAELQVERT